MIGFLFLSIAGCSFGSMCEAESRVADGSAQPGGSVRFERLCFGPATLSSVVAQLSQDSSKDLRVSRELSNEVVALCGDDVSLADALDKLADVAVATWETQGQFQILKRTPKQLRECRQRDLDVRISQLERQLQEYSKEFDLSGTSYDRAREAIRRFELMLKGENQGVWSEGPSGVIDLFLPSDVLLKRILIAIGSKRLSELPYVETVVFSTAPTARQVAFPSSVRTLIEDYAAEQSWFVKASNEEQFASDHPLFVSWWKSLRSQPIDSSDIGKALLSARLEDDRLWTLLQIFDRGGRKRGSAVKAMRIVREVTSQRIVSTIPESALFEPSKRNREFEELARVPEMFVTHHSGPIEPSGLSPTVWEEAIRPNQVEPLSLFLGDLCCEVSRYLGRPVAARLPDFCAPVFSDLRGAASVPLRAVLSQLSQQYGVGVDANSDWILMSPSNALECERTRLNRGALTEVMELARTQPLMDIRAIATLYFKSGTGAFRNPIATFYLNLIAKKGVAVDPYDIPFPLLGLLGSLTDDSWRTTLNGEPFRLSNSGLPSRQYFEGWCSFGEGYDMWIGPGIVQRTRLGIEVAVPDLLLIGTETLPTGVRNDSALSIQAGSSSAFQKVDSADGGSGSQGPSMVFNEEQLAKFCFNMILEGTASSVADAMTGIWRIVPRRQLTIVGALSEQVEIIRVYTGHPVVRSESMERSYTDFPAELRRKLESRVSELLRLARPSQRQSAVFRSCVAVRVA